MTVDSADISSGFIYHIQWRRWWLWDEAQALMFLACAFAVVFALLVGMTRRLLVESRFARNRCRSRRRTLSTHKELRETMLSKEEKEVIDEGGCITV